MSSSAFRPALKQVLKNVRLPGLSSGFFGGCVLTGEDIAAQKTGSGYDIYAVIGCRTASGQRPAANYVTTYRFDPATSKITGTATTCEIPPRHEASDTKLDTEFLILNVI